MEKNVRRFFGTALAFVLIVSGLCSGCDGVNVGGPIPTNGLITKPVCVPIVERALNSPAVVVSPSLIQTIHKVNLRNTCDGQLEAIRLKFDISSTFPVGKWLILEGATTINEGEGSDAETGVKYSLDLYKTRELTLLADTTKARTADSLSARVAAPLRWQMNGQEYESSENLPLAWTTFTY